MSDSAGNGRASLTRCAEFTAYSTAFCAIGIPPMAHLVGPLWALEIGASPLLIGIAMGARSLLPFLFSIHGGALIDQFGVRRIMTFCALAGAVLMAAYPALPSIAALVGLQLITGFLYTVGWIGAQTQITHLTGGDQKYMGRFASITAFSNFLAPPFIGFVWDIGGAWAAYGAISAFSVLLWISVTAMPVALAAPKTRPNLRQLLPAPKDYREAFRLFAVPSIAFVVISSFLLNALFSIRFSFLPVYMEDIGFKGTIIGAMIGGAFLVSSLTSLLAQPVRRLVPPQWAVIAATIFAALGIASTPLFVDIGGLGLGTVVFGGGVGIGMAFVLSLLARAVPPAQMGLSIGLRTTANRFSSFAIPILAGIVIEATSLAAGFYVIAAIVIAGVAAMAIFVRRTPSIGDTFRDS